MGPINTISASEPAITRTSPNCFGYGYHAGDTKINEYRASDTVWIWCVGPETRPPCPGYHAPCV